jgi:hypothetical protein
MAVVSQMADRQVPAFDCFVIGTWLAVSPAPEFG